MQATVTAGGLGAASLAFLLLGCGVGGAWWPLFNVFFIVLLVLPMMFGSHESTGLVGGLGDFLESGLALSIFAFPTVLYRVDELSGGGLFLVYCSNCLAAGTLYVLYRIAQEQSIW